jgi:hypothetical protein
MPNNTISRECSTLLAKEMKHVKVSFVDKFANAEYNKGKYDTWYILVNQLAYALEKEHVRFDKDTFMKNCGLTIAG